jgi:chemotaxis protein methyltransferase CheR
MTVSAEVGARFAELLEKRTGIHLSRTNVGRVSGVLRARAETLGFPSTEAYVDNIEKNVATTEMQTLVNLVTVGKTSFFRYPDIVSAITDIAMPALDKVLHPSRGVHIWSAGCSTGEEPYTLAMALTEAGWFDKRRIRLLATDINTNSLDHARAGRYGHVATAKLLPVVKKHTSVDGHARIINKNIRDRVAFDRLNLAADPFPDPGTWHIIICANVLIYFSAGGTQKVLEKFASAMSAEAVLFLGGAENLASNDRRLSVARLNRAYAYVHGTWNGELAQYRLDGFKDPTTAKPLTSATPIAIPPAAALGTSPFGAPDKTPSKPQLPAPRKKTTSATGEFDLVQLEVDRILGIAKDGHRDSAIKDLTTLRERYPEHAGAARSLGMLLFNERRFDDAIAAIEDAIAGDPLAFDLYFYLGWIYLATDDVDAAREALRRALFLEPGFTFARYELALTLHRAKSYDEAAREYARAEQSAGDPRVRERLRERASGSRETFWINDSFIVELCRSNGDRARQRLTPVTSGRLSAER